jgi:6-phosphogluconate dehydrogenase
MVHNGIEYGDMQLICEAYNIMKNGLGMSADEMHEVFTEWNKGDLDSYLIEITRDILAKKDEDGRRSWTRSSTPPARRAPASGRSSTRRTSASRSP